MTCPRSASTRYSSKLTTAAAAIALFFVLLPACASEDPPPPASEPRFGARREVAALTPAPEGERTSNVQLSVAELAAGDLTGDGNPDVVVTHLRWASVETYPLTILLNDGRGGMRDATAEMFEGPVPRTQNPRQTLLADFNGDRRLDIFIADTGVDVEPFPGALSRLVLSLPDGRYRDATVNVPQRPAFTHCAAAADIDADGDVDLFLGQSPPRLLLNDGTGHFSEADGALPVSLGDGGVLTRAELADIDGDDAPDLVLLGDRTAPAVLINDGTGSFSERRHALPALPFGGNAIGTAIEVLDLSGDGHLDLLLAWTKSTPFYKGRWVQVLAGDGDGSFRDETNRRMPQTANDDQWIYDLVTGDLDGDNSIDLGFDLGPTFADPARSPTPPFFLNRGDGTFAALRADVFADPPFGQFRLVDVDGDGRTDVVSAWAHPSGTETVAVSSGLE